jgi:hypothetical protein
MADIKMEKKNIFFYYYYYLDLETDLSFVILFHFMGKINFC